MKNIIDVFSSYKVIWQSIGEFWWIILPVTFYFLFKNIWMDYAIKNYLMKMDWMMLEIFPPKEIERGPKMMESFFQGIAGVVNTINPFDRYLKGNVTHRFSLELIGNEGKIHFYIRTEKKYRNLIEAQIYAQYPDAEIIEVEDYVNSFPKIIPNKDWDLWGSDVQLVKPEPYPIKTYDKFEEDITGEMIDPMSAILEVLSKLGPGQHIWLQYIIEPLLEDWGSKQRGVLDKLTGRNKKEKKSFWGDIIDVLINIGKGFAGKAEFAKKEKKDEQPLEFKLTPVEREILKSVEENLGKNQFKTKMRFLVFGRRGIFEKSMVPTFFGSIKQFNDINLNSFKPYNASKTSTQYLFRKQRMIFRQRKIWRRFITRDTDGLNIVLSTKEMASVFHFPDMGVRTPALLRVESKKGSAPANLPIQED